MKEPIKYTITLDDDYEQIDNIVRLRLIDAINDMEYNGEYDEPELVFAMLKVLESFSTKAQWMRYIANKAVSYDTE